MSASPAALWSLELEELRGVVGRVNDDWEISAEVLQRRIDWVVDHKVEQCARRIVEQQSSLLGDTRPTDTMEAAKKIAAHPAFKTRDKREAAKKAARDTPPAT